MDWLFTDKDYGYADFYASVDTLVMGYRTYEQILTFGDWPYSGKAAYVLSHSPAPPPAAPVQFVRELPDAGENIWLVGGAQAIQTYADAGRIDEWIISMHPILLGDGIPLFPQRTVEQTLMLVGSCSYPDGLVQLHYCKGGLSDGPG